MRTSDSQQSLFDEALADGMSRLGVLARGQVVELAKDRQWVSINEQGIALLEVVSVYGAKTSLRIQRKAVCDLPILPIKILNLGEESFASIIHGTIHKTAEAATVELMALVKPSRHPAFVREMAERGFSCSMAQWDAIGEVLRRTMIAQTSQKLLPDERVAPRDWIKRGDFLVPRVSNLRVLPGGNRLVEDREAPELRVIE